MERPKLRKRFAYLLLLALLVPLIAACGGPTAAPADATAAAPATADQTAAPATDATTAEPADEETAAALTPEVVTPDEAEATEPAEDTSSGAAGDKVLRIHVTTYPDVVDPQKSSFANEISILSLAYEGLTKLDKDLKAVPAAAESWEFNEAGDEVTFTLREGLQYSDGSSLTSENFRYAIERTCSPETAGEYQAILFEIVGCADWATAPITDTAAVEAGKNLLLTEGVTAPDEQTLVLKLTNPAPYYTYVAGIWPIYPAKKELIEAAGEDWWKDPANHVGNGPFVITEMAEDQLVSMVANENYWGGKPALDGLEFVFERDTAVALEAYRSGQLEVMVPDPSQLPAIKGDPELSDQLLVYAGANSYGWGFNLTQEPFNDKKVREAFAYALDRKTYCEVVRNGDCVPGYSWIPKGIPGSIEANQYEFDPEKAKQALADSSYGGAENLPEVRLTYNADDPAVTPRVEWVAGQLRDILGIEAVLDPVDGTTLTNMRKNKETYPQVCLFCANWFQDYPDPQNWLSVYWTCAASGANRIGYCSEEFDAVTKQADASQNEEERIKLYEQAGQILLDDLPAPMAYHVANIFLVKPEVQGYTTTSADVNWPGQWGSMLSVDINR